MTRRQVGAEGTDMTGTIEYGRSLAGKRVVIVGAGGEGMGLATTRAAIRAGAAVVGLDRNQEELDKTVGRLGAAAGFTGLVADVSVAGEVVAAIDVAAGGGPIDVLVNLAGGTRPGEWRRVEQQDTALLRSTINLNLEYMFDACIAASAHMRAAGGGAIVNFSSVSATTSSPYNAAYGIAKAGVESLTQTLAVEWAEYGIRVNAVSPGATATPKILASLPAAFDISEQEPIARVLDPSEIADVVVFLASDQSRGVNGQVLPVDGGRTARCPLGSLTAFADFAIPARFGG